MDYLPLFQKIRGETCVLVGGGAVAARKFELLHRAGARVRVISPVLGERLTEALAAGAIEHIATHFDPAHLATAALVVAATGKPAVNAAVATAAQARRIPVNVVDAPALCTFIMPAIVDRAPLIVAISSGGRAPVAVRRLRERIEAWLPTRYGDFVAWAGRLRQEVAARVPAAARRRFWERLFDGNAAAEVMAGDENRAAATVAALLSDTDSDGHVSLVGAGPGDPDLLTLKALRALQDADVIVHDRLVSAEILDLARRDADRINVGKRMDNHLLPQPQINLLLIKLAAEGKRVVRLKGGDPFIFGRGGEEAEALAAAGIAFDVVPGISAMSGVAASCLIPLTHREHAAGFNVVAGHRCSGGLPDCDWDRLAADDQTTIFYMGLHNLEQICASLMQNGAPGDRAAAVVANGTTAREQVVTSTLADLPAAVRDAGIVSPALVIVGSVVEVRKRLTGGAAREMRTAAVAAAG